YPGPASQPWPIRPMSTAPCSASASPSKPMSKSFVAGAQSSSVSPMSYSNAAVEARLEALLDPGTRADLEASAKPTALHTCRGLVGGRAVWLAANDTRRARGAIGVAEARQLQDLLQAARRTPAPIFLLLDSAGAKVDEGLAALGAFRRLYREALLTRLAGVPMFALLGRACFGGSSMLAT